MRVGDKRSNISRGKTRGGGRGGRGTQAPFSDQATLTHREGDYREGKLGDRGMCCVRRRTSGVQGASGKQASHKR